MLLQSVVKNWEDIKTDRRHLHEHHMDCWFPLAPPCRSILSSGWGELSQTLYACKVCQPASHFRLHCDYELLAGDASPFFNPPKLLAGVSMKTITVVTDD